MVSHALGINLEGDGNEILLTRENGEREERTTESLHFQGQNWAHRCRPGFEGRGAPSMEDVCTEGGE